MFSQSLAFVRGRYILTDGPVMRSRSDENLAVGLWRRRKHPALTTVNVSGYVETWKRVWKSAWSLERKREVRGESECGLRGPHGVVKSIRPGLEPRLLALLTAVRQEQHQRNWEDVEDVEGRGAWGPRIKYHPRYVPFENATFLHPLHFLLFRLSLWISHLFLLSPSATEDAFLASVCRGVHELSLVFSNSTVLAMQCHVHPRFHHWVFKGSLIECIGTLEMQNCQEYILKIVWCVIRHSVSSICHDEIHQSTFQNTHGCCIYNWQFKLYLMHVCVDKEFYIIKINVSSYASQIDEMFITITEKCIRSFDLPFLTTSDQSRNYKIA